MKRILVFILLTAVSLYAGEPFNFVFVAKRTNEIARGGNRLAGKALSIDANADFLGKRFVATSIPTTSGASVVIFYTKRGTTKVDFIKIVPTDSPTDDELSSYLKTVAAVIEAASGSGLNEYNTVLWLIKNAEGKPGSTKNVGSCEVGYITIGGEAFFLISPRV